jgi:hypothetical protein
MAIGLVVIRAGMVAGIGVRNRFNLREALADLFWR